MDPIPIGRRRWQRSPERRLSDLMLDLQAIRHEVHAAVRNRAYLDAPSQRALVEVRAGWELVAPAERAFQQVLEPDLAQVEGRQPPPTAPASVRVRKAA